MGIQQWIGKEWEQVKPRIRYDIYKIMASVAATAMLGLAVLFMKSLARIPAPLFWGILFLLMLAAFIFLTNRLGARQWVGASISAVEKKPHSDTADPLSVRMTAVICETFEFLKAQGPETDELFTKESEQRIHRVHSGFSITLHDKIQTLIHELAVTGIFDYKLNALIARTAFSEKVIREIAERLIPLRDRVEFGGYKVWPTKAEIAQMTAEEYKQRCKDDPEFLNRENSRD
jgi:hypothetical protein